MKIKLGGKVVGSDARLQTPSSTNNGQVGVSGEAGSKRKRAEEPLQPPSSVPPSVVPTPRPFGGFKIKLGGKSLAKGTADNGSQPPPPKLPKLTIRRPSAPAPAPAGAALARASASKTPGSTVRLAAPASGVPVSLAGHPHPCTPSRTQTAMYSQPQPGMQADAKSKKDAKVLRRVQRDKERAERQEAKQRQQEERTAKAAERKRLREEAKLAKEKDKEARKKERELQREREREARARNEKAAADAAARNTFSFQIPQVGGSGGGLKLKIKIGGLKPSVSKRSDSHDGKVEVLQSQALSAAAVKPEEPSVTSLSDDDFLPSPSEDAKSVLPGRSGKTDMDSRAVADKTEVDDAETTQEAEPTRENLLNLIEKVQKKDHAGIFKDPVTEQLAPGYFNIIKCPMDFTTIRKKLDEEQYLSWDALEADLHLMFDNCMTYNPGGSIYHQQANSMKTMTRDLSKLARRGLVNKRGATAQIMRKFREAEAAAANQARREAQERDRRNRMERTTRRGQIGERKENLVPVEERRSGSYGRGYGRGGSGMRGMSRSMRGVTLDSSIVNAFDETARNSYPPAVPQQMRSWCSLAGGANADGVCFKAGRPCIIQNSFGALPSDAYARSTARYACGLKGKARELVLQRAAACISTYPAPPPPPPSAAAAAAATPQAQMAAGAAAGPLGSGVRGPAAGLGARGTAGVAPPSAGGVAGALKRASGTPGAAGLVPSGICAGLKPPTLAGTGKGVSPGLGSQPQPWQPGGGNPLGAAGGSLSLPFLGQGGGSAFGNLNSTLQSLAALQQSNRPAAAPGAASAAAASPASGASAPAAAPSLGLLGGLNPALLSLVSGQKGLAAPTAPAPAPAAGAVNPAALLSLMQNPTALLQAANLLANINKSQPAAMPGLTPVPQTSSAAATPVVAAAAAAAALGAARPAAPATPGPANPLLASLGLAANLTAPQPPLASSLPSPHSGAAGNAAGNAPGSQP